ncbi:MAG: hypothetical protein OXG44_13350, partial [Gammaproteobacteria bacterium]|nr:hypothetical protein [Gammaproteobacteria bacterium]
TGFSKVEWQHLVVEANRRVALGDGRITNVAGWREVWHQSLADIDATTEPVFHLFAFTEQRQVSNELRYSGWLRPGWEATLGVYIFSQGHPLPGTADHTRGLGALVRRRPRARHRRRVPE